MIVVVGIALGLFIALRRRRRKDKRNVAGDALAELVGATQYRGRAWRPRRRENEEVYW